MVAPLNWGIGHAARCVPIVQKLLEKNQNVLIASDGRALEFMKKEFPSLKHIELPSYNIDYPKKGNFSLHLGKQVPKIFKNIANEHKKCLQICHEHKVNGIISDNRFGCFHKSTESIYITHQLLIPLPPLLKIFEKLGFFIHSRIINKYNKCWIPDIKETPNLSGKLSHTYLPKIPIEYIGGLSRFSKDDFITIDIGETISL
jgi:hypothetical protein